MAFETWGQLLRTALGVTPSSARRKTRSARVAGIECLEAKTLLTAPVVINGNGNTLENVTLNGFVSGSDADNDPLTYSPVALPTHGTLNLNAGGTFTYMPAANYIGPDSFTFVANDGNSNSNVGTFNLTVSSTNAAPVVTNKSQKVLQDAVFNGSVAALGSDAEHDPLTFSVAQFPTHGTLGFGTNGNFLYTPMAGYTGSDSFTFQANDGISNSNVGTYTFTVAANDAPTVADGFGNPVGGVSFSSSVATLASDANGDSLTFAVLAMPVHGTLTFASTGAFTYKPAANYSGSDSFTFRANDGVSDSNTGTFSFTVASNAVPVVVNGSANADAGITFNGTLVPLATDGNGDTLTFSAVALPTHGTLSVNSAGTFTYKPQAGYSGPDSFTFRVNDGVNNSNVGTFSLTVAGNHAPVATDGSGNPDEDVPFPGTVLLQATDEDLDPLTFSVVTTTAHGTLTFAATGIFTYTPAANYNGPDFFTFQANDGSLNSNVAKFSFEVNPVDDPLKLTFQTNQTKIPRNSSPTRIDPSAVLLDPDTTVNFANTRIRAVISNGNIPSDYQKGRIGLLVVDQGSGAGLVHVVGSKIYYNGDDLHPIATFTGGTLGRKLEINFNSTADIFSVNAVLRQLGMKASKKTSSFSVTSGGVTSIGSRLIDVTIGAGGQTAFATKSVNVN